MVRLDEGGWQRDLELIPAPAALGRAVEHFWIQKSLPKDVWRVVPDLSAYVIFSITSGPRGCLADCHVVGARSTFFDVPAAGRTLTIGVRLRPGILPQLLRDSAGQLTDRRARLEDIAGRCGARLLNQMSEASPRDAVHRLAQFLAERLDSPTAPAELFDGMTSVSDLAFLLQRSRRSAYNRLSRTIGLAPKRALRIHRLHKALLELNRGRSLAAAAARAGYCDQAHFSRDAAGLLGEPPGVWQRRRHCSFVQDNGEPG
jgi:AraC-like DNA-binding protein